VGINKWGGVTNKEEQQTGIKNKWGTTSGEQQARGNHGQGPTSEKKPWMRDKEQPRVGATTQAKATRQQKQKKKSNQNLQTTNLA
jgi:hypothetical protein